MTETHIASYSACPQGIGSYETSPSAPRPSLLTCTNGNVVQHIDECNDPHNPCPETGLECKDCPGGWFCPPMPTVPQLGPVSRYPKSSFSFVPKSLKCGMGWACAHCNGNWYCPGSTAAKPSAVKTIASLLSSTSGGGQIMPSGVLPSSAGPNQSDKRTSVLPA
jgi:hypothetical protein